MNQELLFNKYQMYGVVQGQTATIKKKIQSIPANTLLNASEHDLIQALVEEFRLNVPVIKDDEIYIAHSGEAQVDVSRDPMRMIYDRSEPFYIPGNKTVIAVPFEGDVGFFDIQPQTYNLNPPRGQIAKNEILLTYVRTDQNAEAIKQEYQRAVSTIKDYLRWLSESATPFNNQLEGLVTSEVKVRKDRLLADAGMTAAIGLPMKKRSETATTYAVPVTRRVPKIEQIATGSPFKPEPTLAKEDYEEILNIMRNMVRAWNSAPMHFMTWERRTCARTSSYSSTAFSRDRRRGRLSISRAKPTFSSASTERTFSLLNANSGKVKRSFSAQSTNSFPI